MTEIQGKSILVRVSARFKLARVRVIGIRLYLLLILCFTQFGGSSHSLTLGIAVFSPGFCLGESQGPLCWEIRSKVCLTHSMHLRPDGRIFSAFYAPSQIFLWESCKAAAWWEHWYWYSVKLGYQTLLSGKILPNPWLSSIRTLSKITETICLTVAAAVVHIVASLMKYNLKHNTIALKGWKQHETN